MTTKRCPGYGEQIENCHAQNVEASGYCPVCTEVAAAELSAGDYVECCDDAGWVRAVEEGRIEVGWDSGSIGIHSPFDLRLIPRGYQSRHGADHGLPVYEAPTK